MDKYKKWSILVLIITNFILFSLGAITIVVDPYFHYHIPLGFLEYPIDNERYQNDGILKHFQYDAVITGSSMTQNFKTSEFDKIFGVNSVKVSFSGASYKEINENLERAVLANSEIKIILRGLDYHALLFDKDKMRYELDFYPIYLYDNILCNDVKYIFNKTVLLDDTYGVIEYSKLGKRTTTFDEYGNWMEGRKFGKEALDELYERPEKEDMLEMKKEDEESLRENLRQNVIQLAEQNPQIEFYLFFTPYSIYYWDQINQEGMLKKQLEAEKLAIEILLEYDNIHLFSFFDEFKMICDLDNYKDTLHYSENINTQILLWMRDGEHLLTKENYQEYCNREYEFYGNYDYNALFSS
ncbi:MAG: hypothetical protein HFI33_00895 [Lachnospiraceae bacterium]|nr:hypothetical protein [Lachnospiraceae bacterium]